MVVVRRWGLVTGVVLAAACGKARGDAGDPTGAAGAAAIAEGGRTAMAGAATAGAATAGAGNGSAGAATSVAGGATSSSGSAGGATTSAGTGGGPYVLGPDPLPAKEPAGGVKTSNDYLVFTQYDPADHPRHYRLMFIDLKGDGQAVPVAAAGSIDAASVVSGDGRAYVYQQTDIAQLVPTGTPREDDLYLNLFTDSGYLPGARVGGFVGRPALHSPVGFDASSRFAVFSRWQPTTGVDRLLGFDFIDAADNTRYFSLDFSVDAVEFEWAPKGYLFFYRLLPHDGMRQVTQYVAKLIDGGMSQPEQLPVALADQQFTADGRRLFYSTGDGTGPATFGYVEPPAAPRQFYVSSEVADFGKPDGFVIEGGGESVLTALAVPGDPAHYVLWRLFSDGTRPPEAISTPRLSIQVTHSDGDLAAVVSGSDDYVWHLELVRGSEHFDVSVVDEANFGFFVGEHFIYRRSLAGGSAEEVHSATLKGSSVVDTVVGTSDRVGIAPCRPASSLSGGKYSYTYVSPTAGVRFIDLALEGPAATRTIDVTDPAASIRECPVCNQTGDTCAYTERTAAHSKTFSVHFGPNGAEGPKLIFESDQTFALLAAHLP